MAGKRQGSSPDPPKVKQAKQTSKQLHMKAELVLKSKKNANVLCEILEMFNREEKNYTPVLLAVELIFCTMLRRGDMFEDEAIRSSEDTPEAIHARWLRSNYELATSRSLACTKRGDGSSRGQALVTCCKMMAEEGKNPHNGLGVVFPDCRLKGIIDALLAPDQPQTPAIERFRDYTHYRDLQQCGLKLLSQFAFKKAPSEEYMQNYLDLFEALTKTSLKTARPQDGDRNEDEQYLVSNYGSFEFDPELCKKYINQCWGYCVKWPLRATERNHRRALIVLVDRIMPYLTKPALATDLLCDSLDCGSSISMIALRGMLELVTRHKIDFPDIYDRLYGMFEPDIFATRSKKRLIHLADVFLSSTRLSETLVAAFAKRLSRLALLASPEDANDLLQLVASVMQRHPGLKKMLRNDQPAIMPKDPYVMEETCTNASRAIQSSLWEVSALQQHFTPEVSASAAKVLACAESGARPPDLTPACPDHEQFAMEIKKRFKTIEMNFVGVSPEYYMAAEERLNHYWDIACD